MIRAVVEVAGRRIELERPRDRESVSDRSNPRPVWPVPWPAGIALAETILAGEIPLPPGPAIELGCGLGLVGIAAALAGRAVTFTDREPRAVDLAIRNAHANGARDVRGLVMDWERPADERAPWILASDVLYERRLEPILLAAIRSLLAPGGEAWIAGPRRASAATLPEAARRAGWEVESHSHERRDQSIAIFVLRGNETGLPGVEPA